MAKQLIWCNKSNIYDSFQDQQCVRPLVYAFYHVHVLGKIEISYQVKLYSQVGDGDQNTPDKIFPRRIYSVVND